MSCRYLLDENISRHLGEMLQENGRDVKRVSVSLAGALDQEILAFARNENRVLITEDWDFGDLMFSRGLTSYGVVIVEISRFTGSLKQRSAAVAALVLSVEARLTGNLTVVSPDRIRHRSVEGRS